MEGMMVRGSQYGGVGGFTPRTATFTGAQRVSQGDAPYFDGAVNRRIYVSANQGATAWSVALNATFTGLVVSNPAGSRVNLTMLKGSFVLTVAPAGIASIGFFGGQDPAGIVTGTQETTRSTYLDGVAGQGRGYAAATLPGTPKWLLQFMGGFTAAALPATSPSVIDLGGIFVVPPGGYFGIAALTAVTGFASLLWEELPVLS